MKLNAKGLIIIGLVSLFLTSCDTDGTGDLPESFDRSGEELHITVIFYQTQTAIDKAYQKEFGENNIEKLGFSVWADPGNRPYWCQIHVQKPKKLKDEKMKILGHELLHCLIGTFHPEPT